MHVLKNNTCNIFWGVAMELSSHSEPYEAQPNRNIL